MNEWKAALRRTVAPALRDLPATELAWVAFGQCGSVLGVALGVRIVTSVLAPSDYGELVLDLTIAALLAQTILGPAGHAGERFLATAEENANLAEFMAAIRALLLRRIALMVACGSIIGLAAAILAPDHAAAVLVAATTFGVLSGLESVIDSIQNAGRQRIVVALHQAVRSWLRPLAVGVLAWLVGPTALWAVTGYTLASAVVLISQLVSLRRRPHRVSAAGLTAPASGVLEKQMRDYGRPFLIWGLLAWIQLSCDRWALELFAGESRVGLYAVVYQIGAYPLTIMFTIMGQLAAPLVFARAGDATSVVRVQDALKWVSLLAGLVVLVTLVLALLTFVAHATIFRILVGPEYAQASYLLPLAVVAGGLASAGNVVTWAVLVVRNPADLIRSRVGSTVVALVFSFGGVIVMGTTGVLVGMALSAAVYAVWTVTTARHVTRTHLAGLSVESVSGSV